MKKQIVSFAVALAFPALLSAPALAATPQHAPISNRPGFMLGHKTHGRVAGVVAATSTNWSGYAVTGSNGSFTSVSSAWVQPQLNCAAVPKNAYSAYWVGLDGFSNSTVEQIGTEANCVSNQPSYSAWYEMYPSNPYEVSVSLAVKPGDRMSAAVNYQPGVTTTTTVRGRTHTTTTAASYTLVLSDATTGKSFTTSLSPRQTYARASAEVITEAPSSGSILPLADYSTANFTNTLVNGSPMGALPNLQDIIMRNPSGMISTPSTFDTSNEDFSTTWSAS